MILMNTIKRKEESLRNRLFLLNLKIESLTQLPKLKTLLHIKFLITQEENKHQTKMRLKMMKNIFNN
jgi:hypothetical protein